MAYKNELKRGKEMIPPSRQLERTRMLLTKQKFSSRQRVRNPLKPQLLQPRQFLEEPEWQGTRCRNKQM